MAQHDYLIENNPNAQLRADLNNALKAIAENNSGPTAPTNTHSNQWWFDESANELKIRSADNNSWFLVAKINQSTGIFMVASIDVASMRNLASLDSSADLVPVFDASVGGMRKTPVDDLIPRATQAQAEGGADNTTLMTPLRTKQFIQMNCLSSAQSWVNVTSSRALGSTYQNTTGRPIFAAMDIAGNNSANPSEYYLEVSINQSTWIPICAGDVGNFNNSAGCSGLIPAGSYYRYRKYSGPNTVTTLDFWSEFR